MKLEALKWCEANVTLSVFINSRLGQRLHFVPQLLCFMSLLWPTQVKIEVGVDPVPTFFKQWCGPFELTIVSLIFTYTGKRQTSDSSWEFLKIENELIKTASNNSYRWKIAWITDLCVEMINSKRQVKGETWSRGTNSLYRLAWTRWLTSLITKRIIRRWQRRGQPRNVTVERCNHLNQDQTS